MINAKNHKLIKSFRVGSSNNAIKQIKFARKGESFLVNSFDRVIRVYDASEIVKFEDPAPEGKAPLLSTIEPVQKVFGYLSLKKNNEKLNRSKTW